MINNSKINRRNFLGVLGTSAFIMNSVVGCNTVKLKNEGQPNFLILFADDQGFGDLSLHGNQYLETPNIDSFAKESVQFKNFFVQSCCAPTRASLLTGRGCHEVGVWGVSGDRRSINPKEELFSDTLKKGGYKTFMAGKWHSGRQGNLGPWNRGFDDVYLGSYNPTLSRYTYNGAKPEKFEDKWQRDFFIKKCVDFMKINKNNKFCAYMPFFAPHTPWIAPERLVKKYEDKGCTESLSKFNAYMEHLDEGVGSLLKSLKDLGLDKNTVVIYMSDNGPMRASIKDDSAWASRNPQEFRGEKGDIWDLGIRSPLFIRYANFFKPTVVKTNTCIEDIYPTLLEMAQIKKPKNKKFSGRSILPLLTQSNEKWKDRYIMREDFDPHWVGKTHQMNKLDDYSLIKYEDQSLTIRNQRFKLCKVGRSFDFSDRNYEKKEGYQRGPEYQLYDMSNEQKEKINVIDKYPEIANDMKKAMKEWYAPIMAEPEKYFTTPLIQIGYSDKSISKIPFIASSVSGVKDRVSFKETPLWSINGDTMRVRVDVVKTGKYQVIIHCKKLLQGTEFEISVNGSKVSRKFDEKTSSFNDVGEIALSEKGETSLTIKRLSGKLNKKALIKPFYIAFEKKLTNKKNYIMITRHRKRKIIGLFTVTMLLVGILFNSNLIAQDTDGMGDLTQEELNKIKGIKTNKKKGKKGKKSYEPTFPEVYKTDTDAKEDIFEITDKVIIKNAPGIGVNLKGSIFRPKDQSNFNIYNPSGSMEPIKNVRYFFIDDAKDCTPSIIRRKDDRGLAIAQKKQGTVKIRPGSIDGGTIRHFTIKNDKYEMVHETKIKDYKLRSFYGEDVDEFVEFVTPGPQPQDKDIFQVESEVELLPRINKNVLISFKKSIENLKAGKETKYHLFILNACKPYARWTENWEDAFSIDMSEKCPEKNSSASMKIEITGKGPHTHFVTCKIPKLPKETMVLDVWAKQKGMKTGTVKIRIGGFKGKQPPVYYKEIKVGSNWKKYSLTIEVTEEIANVLNGQKSVSRFLSIGSDEKGTLWIDNYFFYRKNLKPFAIIPEGKKLFEYMQPSAIRHWATGTWGFVNDKNMRGILLKDTSNLPFNRFSMNLKMCLELCKVAKSTPWLMIDTFPSKEDINALIEYLAAPKDIGYGKVRAEQGHPEPWINEFDNIYFECDNEMWGMMSAGDPNQYVPIFNYWASLFRESKYYKEGYFKLIANGWTLVPVGKLQPPEHKFQLDKKGEPILNRGNWGIHVVNRTQCDVFDFSSYMRGFDGIHHLGDDGDVPMMKNTLMRGEYYNLMQYKMARDYRDELRKKDKNRRYYQFAGYEGGPGFSLLNPAFSAPNNQSLATAISSLNVFLKSQRDYEFLDHCIHKHSFGMGFSTFNKNGEPLIMTNIMRMHGYCKGDMINVKAIQCKTVEVPNQQHPYLKKKNDKKPKMSFMKEGVKGIPLTNLYAYKKDKQYSFMVYNLAYDEPRKITLNLSYSPSSKAKMYFVTGDSRDHNGKSEKVKIQEKSISDFKNGYSFTIAPCSAYVIINEAK